jgi:chemotaxis protein methyltransferase CheR
VSVLDFEYLRKFLRERSGLVLAADKQYLAESRLLPVARAAGLDGVAELVQALRRPHSEQLAGRAVEAMTTNESFFFRDRIPFDQFRESVLPELMARRASRRRIRIWCAAASTGQEPYSLAMSLKEMGERICDWRIEIVATDISNEVLEKARSGIYTQFEVQRGLPIASLLKHFSKVGDNWQIAPDIRTMVQFRALNLIADFAHLGVFDLVFCRNVLLYFDQETKSRVLDRVARVTERDGYLVLGAAETVVGLTGAFKPVVDRRGLYAPTAAAGRVQAPAKAAPSLRVVAAAG